MPEGDGAGRPGERTPGERTPDERWPDERHAGFRRVDCDRCAAAVLVIKFSPQHTSVQWSRESVRACAEFSARTAAGEQSALIDSCASLRGSIDRALSQGRLEVSPP
jgi:hypothetical protein